MAVVDFDEAIARNKQAENVDAEYEAIGEYFGNSIVDLRRGTKEEDRKGADWVVTLRAGSSGRPGAKVLIDSKRRYKCNPARWQIEGVPDLAIETWSVVGKNGMKGVAGWAFDESKITDYVLFTWAEATDQWFMIPHQALRQVCSEMYPQWILRWDVKSTWSRSRRGLGNWESECLFVPATVVWDAISRASGFEHADT